VASYKIARRHDQDISAVCATFRIRREGTRVTEARLAFGGMAGTARRAAAAEQALTDADWSIDSIRAAQAALARDFAPLSDLRASSAYRLEVAGALLERCHRESLGEAMRLPTAPLDPAELQP
jgi:xanthine dehydrogenase small subunit